MKVIGMIDSSTYLCEVSHSELEKSVDLYYGNLDKLRVGSTLNLGDGYDFRADIKNACSTMANAEASFVNAQKTLYRFAMLIAAQAEGDKA